MTAAPSPHITLCVGFLQLLCCFVLRSQAPMNITASSSKDELITAAVELTDSQAERINQLEQHQQALWVIVAVLSALVLL